MKIAALLPLIMVAGCSMLPGSEANRFAKAEGAVRDVLVDPDSAKFKSMSVSFEGNVCGMVNSKNRFGGYNGDVPFIVTPKGEAWVSEYEIADKREEASPARWRVIDHCAPDRGPQALPKV